MSLIHSLIHRHIRHIVSSLSLSHTHIQVRAAKTLIAERARDNARLQSDVAAMCTRVSEAEAAVAAAKESERAMSAQTEPMRAVWRTVCNLPNSVSYLFELCILGLFAFLLNL